VPKGLKFAISSLLIGAMSVGVAWAGSVLVPADPIGGKVAEESSAAKTDQEDMILPSQATTNDGLPAPGTVVAGAAKVSLEPRPEDYQEQFPGARWETSRDACSTFSTSSPPSGDHLASTGSPWPENPDCIYMGGFGLGPENPITEWDTAHPENCESGDFRGCGIYARTFAVKGPNGKTFTATILDAEGYLWDYKKKCERCGIKQITEDLAAEPGLGLEKEGIVIGSTHTHSGPEFLGGWGFVPDWYMQQVTDSIKESIRQAVTSMQPAVLEMGQELARQFNHERRDTYHSAEEQQLTWLRAVTIPGAATTSGAESTTTSSAGATSEDGSGNANGHDKPGHPKNTPTPTPTPTPEPSPTEEPKPETIGTLVTYAGHPVSFGTNGGRASADWVGPFEHAIEKRFGGTAVYFMTGLGNMSNSGGRGVGTRLVDLLPAVGGGTRLDSTDVRYAQTIWNHPATNVPLNALGLPGFFDREFVQAPTTINTGKNPETAPCTSASAVGVEMPANAMKIGNQFALTTSPGEIFSNVSNVIKEKSGAVVTMPLAQTQDALGYMPQQIEINEVGQQGLGFFAGGFLIVNYEDSYAIDRCIGDAALEKALGLVRGIQ
jgi:hypothetical protein